MVTRQEQGRQAHRSRGRWWGSRWRSVRFRIMALIMVPLVLLSLLWAYALYLSAESTLYLSLVARTEAAIHGETAVLFDALQEERRATSAYLGGDRGAALTRLREETDRAAAGLQTLVTDDVLSDVNPTERRWLEALRDRLTQLDDLRGDVDGGGPSQANTESRYTAVLQACIGVFSAMTTDINPNYGFYHQTMVSLQVAREALSQEDALLAGAIADGELSRIEYETFVRRVGAQRSLFAEAEAGITDEQIRGQYQDTVQTDAFNRLHGLEDAVVRAGSGSAPFTAAAWNSARTQVMQDLRHLEHGVYNALTDRATPIAIRTIVNLVGIVVLGLVILVLSITLNWRGARRLIRQLITLKDTALNLAHKQLPGVVRRLQHGEPVDVQAEAPPLEFGPDEIGDVGRAFNAVQQTAVQAAVDQARLREGIKDVFVNLARRNQSLLKTQIEQITEMERRTDDPDELERLFAIDHLATRMRRHAEDLIILSGSPPGRRWRKPVPMVDVVRGAIGEIERYARVTLLPIAEAQLSGRAVADVIHLLAELFENATLFSPPQTKVRVSGELVPNGYVVEIEDQGLGMPPEDLARFNERLANPPEFTPADTVRLGLLVVGRLAQRHGIRVHLRRSPYGGITAIVLIPSSLVETPAEITQGGGSRAQAPVAPVSPPASPSAGSLALPAADSGVVTSIPASAGPRPPIPFEDRVVDIPAYPTHDAQPEHTFRGLDTPPTDPSPVDTQAVSGVEGEPVDLPRRVRQASLAEELRETAPEHQEPAQRRIAARTPEQIRAVMSTIQRGSRLGRGEVEAAEPGTMPANHLPSPRPSHPEDE